MIITALELFENHGLAYASAAELLRLIDSKLSQP